MKKNLRKIFNIKFDKVFGMDISDSSIEVMELYNFFTNTALSFGRISLPSEIVRDGKILNSDALAENIKKVLMEVKPRRVSTNRVVLSLPESQTFTHTFVSEAMRPSEVSQRIISEVTKILPININKIYWDYVIKNLDGGKKLILFVGIQKEVIDEYLRVCGSLGLEVVSLSLQSISLARVLLKESSKQSVIVDIGNRSTNISIIDSDDKVNLAIGIPVGGQNFIEGIMSELKINPKEAEALRRQWGFKEVAENKVLGVMKPVLKDILNEVNGAINYYEKLSGQTVDQAFFVGGSSTVLGFNEAIKKELKSGIELVLPKKYFQIKTMPETTCETALFANVIGLALLGTNGVYEDVKILDKITNKDAEAVSKINLLKSNYMSKSDAFRALINNKAFLLFSVLVNILVFTYIVFQFGDFWGVFGPLLDLFKK